MVGKTITIIVCGIFLCLSLAALITISVVFGITSNVGYMHSVVLDAGSTSTKLNLYQWKDYPFRTNGNVKQIKEAKQSPGISDYVNDPFSAYPKLEPKLQALVAEIPQQKLSQVPVYLAATAGMRLTLIDEPMKTLELFDVLRRGLLTSGLEVEIPNERIRMLSGAEEGLFGWVSVNSILGLVTGSKQVPPSETMGSLDLGGASTQIAFVSPNPSTTGPASMFFTPLRLFGSRYVVYSHSFLCYGKNEFYKRAMGTVYSGNPTPPDNPCYLNGYVSEASVLDSIYSGPCMTGKYANEVFGNELKKPTTLPATIVGSGDPVACRAAILKNFQTTQCTNSPCSFNNIHQPAVSGSYRAYSGFSFVMKHLFPNKTTGFTKMEVQNAVDTFCKKTWAEVTTGLKPSAASFVAMYCFDGQFVVALLENYGFKTDESWKKITFGDKIDGQSVSWALGYMLDQSGFLPSDSPKLVMPVPLFGTLFAIFLLVFIICLGFLLFTLCC